MSGQSEGRRSFYKYVTASTGEAIIRNATLRWSTPATLNDPFDTQFDLHIDVNPKIIKLGALERLRVAFEADEEPKQGNDLGRLVAFARSLRPSLTWERFSRNFEDLIEEGIERGTRSLPEMHRAVRAELATSKILCLSSKSDSLPMWAYYADAHRGLVLHFESVEGLDSPYRVAQPVSYQRAMPLLCDEQFFISMFAGEVSLDPNDTIHRIVFTKALEWSHETEWRIYSGDGRYREAPYEDIPFHPQELKTVFLGCRMPEPDQLNICRLLSRYPHVQIFRMVKAPRAFAVDALPLTSACSA